MSDELPDMSETARALLRGEKGPLSAAPGKARVATRLDATLFGPAGGGGGGGGAGGEPAKVAAPTGSAATSAVSGAKWMSHAVIGLVGVVMGVALTVALRKPDVMQAPPTVVSVYVDRAPPPSATPVTPIVLTSATPVTSTSAQAATSASAPVQQRPDTLSEERALLDPARTALGRGDGASALSGVQKHEQRFPKGQLTEEREAIAVQALVALRRGDEGRARGERFKRTYPNSVLAPAVNAALDAIPK